MSINPVKIIENVASEYENYLRTEFHAKDPDLKKRLEEALREPKFLTQETFYQSHKPFKQGVEWNKMGLDEDLVKVLQKRFGNHSYVHQTKAVSALLSLSPSPVVVTTGTGSGKTECFLIPVIQNAIRDAMEHHPNQSGLTAILIYPMNALANDQQIRINEYLNEMNLSGGVKVAKYDRTTKEEERISLRKNPPHILLTNYMMLEYLLIRPADRDSIFKNHRCRFAVLDEVHTYRGSLGTNIAFLIRRLKAHLRAAERTDGTEEFPELIPVGTSATIRSESGDMENVASEVQKFFSKLTGTEPNLIQVIGEERESIEAPLNAKYSDFPELIQKSESFNEKNLCNALAKLSGMDPSLSLKELVSGTKILWDLNEIFSDKPRPIQEAVEFIRQNVSERKNIDIQILQSEIITALTVAAGLPDSVYNPLKYKAHKFIRGGWQFRRCVDPDCGKLYGMGEEKCKCDKVTAPLYICRSCGADALRFSSDSEGMEEFTLKTDSFDAEGRDWYLYKQESMEEEDDDSEDEQMKGRKVIKGISFDPVSLNVSSLLNYGCKVTLAPANNRCMVCQAYTGRGSILTPIRLGTSAAIKVIAENLLEELHNQHKEEKSEDTKERLLIFSDSRQDAAHQARFINYSIRYDRMRRRTVEILDRYGEIDVSKLRDELFEKARVEKDNHFVAGYNLNKFIQPKVQEKGKLWEIITFLDDLCVSPRYRATIFNLGLAGVKYEGLKDYSENYCQDIKQELNLDSDQYYHILKCILDEFRLQSAVSFEILKYNPAHPRTPEELKEMEWERRRSKPVGYSINVNAEPVERLEKSEIPDGVDCKSFWRKEGQGGKAPRIERIFKNLLFAMKGITPTWSHFYSILASLVEAGFLVPSNLYGFSNNSPISLLQLNYDTIKIKKTDGGDAIKCGNCNYKSSFLNSGFPCPICSGILEKWIPDIQNSHIVRIKNTVPYFLKAEEHTAQVSANNRIDFERNFKAESKESKLNVLSCSPTMEMGIDIGGLDSIIMRNVPPRPDNYAQRSGRAGRKNRIGVVLGYAKNTPHDSYYYDHPEEMISGAVPPPLFGLLNRDILTRHINSIIFGLMERGLQGRMAVYINTQGEPVESEIEKLIEEYGNCFGMGMKIAENTFDNEAMQFLFKNNEEKEDFKKEQEEKIQNVFKRLELQVQELRKPIEYFNIYLRDESKSGYSARIINKLLGIPIKDGKISGTADDRSSGNPMRRFAEFGILPGYEFPSEPATLRLLGDESADEPITTSRTFGIVQYQPEALVYARGKRWKVSGLDISSPWNNRNNSPDWIYKICSVCSNRIDAQDVNCKKCRSISMESEAINAYEFGGFIAFRNETAIIEEEERISIASNLRIYPQWNQPVDRLYSIHNGWKIELRKEEEIRWLNEKFSGNERIENGLHSAAEGFLLCPSCGKILKRAAVEKSSKKRKILASENQYRQEGHSKSCPFTNQNLPPIALSAKTLAQTMRICFNIPENFSEDEYLTWGNSLGYALSNGMRMLYMLDGSEFNFVLEPFWTSDVDSKKIKTGCLTYIDSTVGGSGFLEKASMELDKIARESVNHLIHKNCESACYRCLKSYENQRLHRYLNWTVILNTLEELSMESPTEITNHKSPTENANEWLEAFHKGFGSPLEQKAAEILSKFGIEYEKQVEVSPNEGEDYISIADLRIKGTSKLIYIDGAVFHTGMNKRRDKYIRERLSKGNLNWNILTVTYKDLLNERIFINKVKEL